jgi:hypothetical protein
LPPASGSAGIKTIKSGTATARIRFVSDVKWGAKIVFSGIGMAWDSKGAYVDIDGFDISGSGRLGILAEGGNLTITNNFIHDLKVSGGCNGSGGAAIDTWGPSAASPSIRTWSATSASSGSATQACNTVQGIYVTNQNKCVSNNVISGVARRHQQLAWRDRFDHRQQHHLQQQDGHRDRSRRWRRDLGRLLEQLRCQQHHLSNAYGITEMGKVGTNNRYVEQPGVQHRNRSWLARAPSAAPFRPIRSS